MSTEKKAALEGEAWDTIISSEIITSFQRGEIVVDDSWAVVGDAEARKIFSKIIIRMSLLQQHEMLYEILLDGSLEQTHLLLCAAAGTSLYSLKNDAIKFVQKKVEAMWNDLRCLQLDIRKEEHIDQQRKEG